MRTYSADLRQRILAAVLSKQWTQAEIATRFSVSLSFVEKLLYRWRRTGSLAPAPHRGGRRRAIAPEDEPVLMALLEADNDATDAEIAARFVEATGRRVSPRTVNRMWQRLGLTRKKRRSGPANRPAPTSPLSVRPSAR